MGGEEAAKCEAGLTASVLGECSARARVFRWEGVGFLIFCIDRGLFSMRCQRGQLWDSGRGEVLLADCRPAADVVLGGMPSSRESIEASEEEISAMVYWGGCAAAERTCSYCQSHLQWQVELSCISVGEICSMYEYAPVVEVEHWLSVE